jgi:protein NrfC
MIKNNKPDQNKTPDKNWNRRQFLVGGGTALAAGAITAATSVNAAAAPATGDSFPKSRAYLVYDSKKCMGCTTCMLACSLTHYGVQSLSFSRIQIIQDSFGKFPDDIQIAPCRQCVTPVCVQNCPVGAAYVDTENGNVRRIDSEKCIGCQTCLRMCPQQPHRTIWNHVSGKSTKCDLCIDTPYWNEEGGPDGKQACVSSCPMQALKVVHNTPDQKETEGYNVNLRNEHYINLGLVDDSRIIPPIMQNQQPKTPGKPKPKAKE